MIHEVLKGLIYIHSSSYLHLFQFYFHSTLETSKQPIFSSIPTDPSVSPTSASFPPPTPPNVTPLTDSSERPAGWLPKWSATVSSLHPYPASSLWLILRRRTCGRLESPRWSSTKASRRSLGSTRARFSLGFCRARRRRSTRITTCTSPLPPRRSSRSSRRCW